MPAVVTHQSSLPTFGSALPVLTEMKSHPPNAVTRAPSSWRYEQQALLAPFSPSVGPLDASIPWRGSRHDAGDASPTRFVVLGCSSDLRWLVGWFIGWVSAPGHASGSFDALQGSTNQQSRAHHEDCSLLWRVWGSSKNTERHVIPYPSRCHRRLGRARHKVHLRTIFMSTPQVTDLRRQVEGGKTQVFEVARKKPEEEERKRMKREEERMRRTVHPAVVQCRNYPRRCSRICITEAGTGDMDPR
ncbi:hypothetical protein CPB84DRAFT_1748816 [Gymnopilus junonius]|uniref:Uncharacterized protein n=1 Tax=Gymnopilus junonius TaxID=109634 RepID=A0A9P5NM06_GYMJU|nr:hypothetical protein CPB84DRAFT_1748816 [Gymnopilus junonius]